MAKALQDERVTMGFFFIHHIHDLLNLPNLSDYDFSSLDIVNIGGSVIPFEMRRKLENICKYVVPSYGMTEVMLTHLSHPNDPEEKLKAGALYPIGGTETKIVNDNGFIVPVNTIGELHIRTYSAFLYYVGEEKKTREMKDGNGWIHSGDLGVMDEDGYIQICGRKKVIGLPDSRVGEEICACLRVDKENAPSEEEIRQFCNGKVHELLVPKYILFVDEIPTSGSGKFSRQKLTEMAMEKFPIV
ncbi:medium-chain acyl-CoA ligase ACSF2, mitochondrial-like isoform X3 [Amphiura filiformis]|uniref:medium-chain acyl-CoA ligase ACSF2, mitochondrial-like isoform X3 n=1 Tax=Amphiura filiformis TaxID=82378 RepID=UPI003B218374